mgnify:CR=1 FL=1
MRLDSKEVKFKRACRKDASMYKTTFTFKIRLVNCNLQPVSIWALLFFLHEPANSNTLLLTSRLSAIALLSKLRRYFNSGSQSLHIDPHSLKCNKTVVIMNLVWLQTLKILQFLNNFVKILQLQKFTS